MKRREFITLLGGAAVAWPVAARAQQGEPMRRIGVLMNMGADDTEGQDRLAALTQALKQLGWSEGRNLRIDTRWAAADDIRRHAAELAALAPDVLVAGTGTATVAPLLQATRAVRPCLRLSSTRSALVSSRAWHSRAATRLGSRFTNTA